MLADAKMTNLLFMDISDIARIIRNLVTLFKSQQNSVVVLQEAVNAEIAGNLIVRQRAMSDESIH